MISRARAVDADEAVAVTVSAGFLIYSQELGRQVGAGEVVRVHPATLPGWVRNGWVTTDAPAAPAALPQSDDAAPAALPQDEDAAPAAPRRGTRRTAK
jgi:hypothetical protein